ncbi:hypothetical protein K488DRAFT_73364 [Vararia minispora EC-137]|uniref:Uncharacterized protein n=1 Tax=Vararia minispora EC-137 TaxID=1314806 RepID=A0ACB8QB73_9AGAM|nr:hypothetical protein K488DRAFT_73364 [Vararia minispora EC-137]
MSSSTARALFGRSLPPSLPPEVWYLALSGSSAHTSALRSPGRQFASVTNNSAASGRSVVSVPLPWTNNVPPIRDSNNVPQPTAPAPRALADELSSPQVSCDNPSFEVRFKEKFVTKRQLFLALRRFGHLVGFHMDSDLRWVARFASRGSASMALKNSVMGRFDVFGRKVHLEPVYWHEGRFLTALFVAGISSWTSTHDLEDTFRAFGHVLQVQHSSVELRPDTVRILLRGSKNSARDVIEHAKRFPIVLHGRTLRVEISKLGPPLNVGNRIPQYEPNWTPSPIGPQRCPAPWHPIPIRETKMVYQKLIMRMNHAPCRKLIVSNLPALPDLERTLAYLFNAVGPVIDMHTSVVSVGEMHRVVHVEYPTTDAAVWAAHTLLRHRFVLKNRIRIGFAEHTKDTMRTRTVYVSNWPAAPGTALPDEELEIRGIEELRKVFKTQDGFQACILLPSFAESAYAPAFVTFGSVEDAQHALINLLGTVIPGTSIPLELTFSELPHLSLDELFAIHGAALQGDLELFPSASVARQESWRSVAPASLRGDPSKNPNSAFQSWVKSVWDMRELWPLPDAAEDMPPLPPISI